MKRQELLNVLAAHADTLNAGYDNASQWLAQYPEREAELNALFQLAGQIKNALIPLDVPDQFRRQLQHGLLTQPLPLESDSAGRPMRMWWGMAAAGSLLSLAGLSLLLSRRLRPESSKGVSQTVATAR